MDLSSELVGLNALLFFCDAVIRKQRNTDLWARDRHGPGWGGVLGDARTPYRGLLLATQDLLLKMLAEAFAQPV